jgi:hypothetical protein
VNFILSLERTKKYVKAPSGNISIDDLPLLLQKYLQQACTEVGNNHQDNENLILSVEKADSGRSFEATNRYVNFLLNDITNFAHDL